MNFSEPALLAFLAAAAALIAPTAAVIVAHFITKRRLTQIHVLVNSRLTEALKEIQDLKITLSRERDSAARAAEARPE